MGKLMGSKVRSLLLCALLLALPSLAAAQCVSQLTVQSVLTQDTNGNNKTTFAPGDPIRFAAQLNNAYGGTLLGAQITITTSFFSNSSSVNIPPGMSTWTWNTTVPSQQANYTVTVSAFDRVCGFFVSASASFTVGQVTVPLPDLNPTAILYKPADLVPGKTVFFDSGVQNSGSQGTGVFNVRWSVDGVSAGAGSHAGVPANSTVLDGNSQFSWVATAGTHTITFTVDFDNQVVESDESNNSISVTVTVTQTPPPTTQFTLTLNKSGTGSGTVTSSQAGISCGSTCSASFAQGTNVTLTATAASGSTFTGWSGEGCSGSDTCTVSMTQARNVTATFQAIAQIPSIGWYSNSGPVTIYEGTPK